MAINVDGDSNDALDIGYGGTGSQLTDPAADRVLFWDDSAAAGSNTTWLTLGTGLSITATTINVTWPIAFTSDYSSDFDAAVVAIAATPTTLYVDDATTMSTNVTVPATCTVIVLKGGSIDQATNTLTFNGPLIFDGGTIDNDAALTINGGITVNGDYQIYTNTTVPTYGDFTTVKPVWYGTTGDGAADDVVPLQYAIDSLATAGGVVDFTKVHYISSYLEMKYDDMHLYGNGGKGGLKNTVAMSPMVYGCSLGVTAGAVTIRYRQSLREMYFEGYSTYDASEDSIAYFSGIDGLWVKDCIFKHNNGHVIATQCLNVDISGNTFNQTHSHNCVTIGLSYNVRVENNTFLDFGDTANQDGGGVCIGTGATGHTGSLTTSKNINIIGNTFYGDQAYWTGAATKKQFAIFVEYSAEDINIADNVISDCSHGIYFYLTDSYNSHDLRYSVDNNTIKRSRHALVVTNKDAATDWQNISITNNKIYEAEGYGININYDDQNTTTTGIVISDNYVTKCTSHGIVVYDVEGFQIKNNTCIDNGEDTSSAYSNFYLQVLDTGIVQGNIGASLNSGGSALLLYNMYVNVGNTNNTVKVYDNILVPKGSHARSLTNVSNQARCFRNTTNYTGNSTGDVYQLTADLTIDATYSGITFFSDDPAAADRTVTLAAATDLYNVAQYGSSDELSFKFLAWDETIIIQSDATHQFYGGNGTDKTMTVNSGSYVELIRGPDTYWIPIVHYGTVTHE